MDNGGLTVLKKASYVLFAWFNAFDLFVYSLYVSPCDFPWLPCGAVLNEV